MRSSPADAHGALSYLWARRRLERLSDFAPAKENNQTRDQVTQIGLTYNLLTAYTSFVAVYEKVRTTDGAAQEVDQPLPLPHHVSRLAVGARHVPEPELSLMVACVVLSGLWMAWRLWKSAA